MVKRILGILLMLVGAFGVLTCVLAGLHTWRMAEDVAAMADDTLGLLLDTLDGVERSLGVVSATLDNAAMGIGSLHTTTLGVGETLSTTRSTLGGIAHLAEGDLSQSLEFSIVTLKTLEQTAGMADDVLRGLSLLGVGGYDPSAPLSQSIARIRKGLDPVPDSLRQVGSSLRGTAANLEGMRGGVVQTGNRLLDIQENVLSARANVAGYVTLVRRWQQQVRVLRRSADRAIKTVAWAATLLLTWIGLSQLAIVQWGISLMGWGGKKARAV